MREYEFHPIANVFPLIEGEEFDDLVASIKDRGLREPIVIYQEKVLDGRNRDRACEAAGVKPTYTPFDGTDPVAFVVDKNLRRRHMDTSQRAMVAANIALLPHGDGSRFDQENEEIPENQSKVQICTLDAPTVKQAAAAMKVSERSAKKARKVRTKAVNEVQKAVADGKMSVDTAAKAADLPADKQREVAETANNGTKKEATAKLREFTAVNGKKMKVGSRDLKERANKALGNLIRVLDDMSIGKRHLPCLQLIKEDIKKWSA